MTEYRSALVSDSMHPASIRGELMQPPPQSASRLRCEVGRENFGTNFSTSCEMANAFDRSQRSDLTSQPEVSIAVDATADPANWCVSFAGCSRCSGVDAQCAQSTQSREGLSSTGRSQTFKRRTF
jgi:hypothetical protein